VKKSLWQTIALVFSLVALGSAGFFAGYHWPRASSGLEISNTPEQAELKLSLLDGELHGRAPESATLMLGKEVVEAGRDFNVALEKTLPLRWWGETWAVVLEIPENLKSDTSTTDPDTSQTKQENFVASKSGAKYHPTENCQWADRIKPENRIFFSTEEEAQAAGYEPSSCLTNN